MPAASSGPALRGKGWVAGVSDSLGLSLSGDCYAACYCELVALDFYCCFANEAGLWSGCLIAIVLGVTSSMHAISVKDK